MASPRPWRSRWSSPTSSDVRPPARGPAGFASGSTDFGDAAELACAAVKHGTEPPAPFAPLSTEAYREYGAELAVQWAETTFERLD